MRIGNRELKVCCTTWGWGCLKVRIFDSFGLMAADQLKFAKEISELDCYFVPQKNVVHESAIFHQCHQQHGEAVEAYLSTLCELA